MLTLIFYYVKKGLDNLNGGGQDTGVRVERGRGGELRTDVEFLKRLARILSANLHAGNLAHIKMMDT